MDFQPFRPNKEFTAMPSATATLPLQDLAQRIRHQEMELARLHDELEARKTQLTTLARRKEQLQAQLNQVEAEIASVDQAALPMASSTSSPKSTSLSTPRASHGDGKTSGKATSERISLPKLLISLVQRAKKPVSIKDLVAGVVSNKYPTKATDLQGMVENRVSDLVKAKTLKRVANQPGVVVIGKVTASATGTSTTASVAKPVATRTPSSENSNSSEKKVSLKEALIQVLAKSSRPLTTQQLADQVLASGYQTKSKDFKNVIWVGIGNLDNVENIRGKGYRLRAGKATMNKKKGED
jgi:hypothetical protein